MKKARYIIILFLFALLYMTVAVYAGDANISGAAPDDIAGGDGAPNGIADGLISDDLLSEVSADIGPALPTALDLNAKSVILMEASSGMILYESNADEALPPASVTKIMSILLIMEAIDDGVIKIDDMVSVSENAASMGGSQVYLEPGETLSVEELLKCVIIASANDATVALAEFVAGDEDTFVARMNERAAELDMKNTHFVNTNGLDDGEEAATHLISARDIAIVSRELTVKHPAVFNYTTIWMDTIRGGAFGLTNTNRLVRFYRGATGLKTGSTSKAGFCISATATRDGMALIAVVMGSPTRDIRNEAAKSLLDFGFANYCTYVSEGASGDNVPVTGGVDDFVASEYKEFSSVQKKGRAADVIKMVTMNESVPAPVHKGDIIGEVTYTLDGEVIGTTPVTAVCDVEKISYFGLIYRILRCALID